MKGYHAKVKQAQVHFKSFTLRQISRGHNSHVDSLVMLATSLGSNLPRVVIVEDMVDSSLVRKPLVDVRSFQVEPNWMVSLVAFLKQGLLSEDKGEVRKIRRKAPRYWLSEEQKLYKRSHFGPNFLCVHPKAVEPYLEELHEEICESHTEGRSLAYRALAQGYWWPSMQKTSQEYVRKYDQCQRYALNIHQPEGVLNPLPALGD